MTIEETRQERHKLVAEALKQKAEKKAPPKPPVPDIIIEEPKKAAPKKPKDLPLQKAKKKEPAKKEQ